MKKYYIFLTAVVIFIASCKKETAQNIHPTTKNVDSSLLFLDNTISDSCNENSFYIKGNFNGHNICLATTGDDRRYNPFFVDTFMNAFFIFHSQGIITNDDLYLLRQNSNQSIMIALYCGQTHIKNRKFPYSQPNENLEHCEFTELQFINMNHNYSIGQNSPQDNYTFQATTGLGITITFTSLSVDNIIEGYFSGIIRTNTGSTITVTDGKFRIKFLIDDVYIGQDTTANNSFQQLWLDGLRPSSPRTLFSFCSNLTESYDPTKYFLNNKN